MMMMMTTTTMTMLITTMRLMMKKTSVVLDNRITRLVVLTYSNLFKDGLSLKIKILHIHLYFIATPYLYNYALVEDIDN